ncbi:FUSC family protein [Sphingomonas sp. PR090111-T3T-6A]|uniref:FUSC family protein n=1 Tax=Sphingomonas sp. PR090111-T3T-6A TaxID=685778 RepID=UPI000368053C|nr:FUSC family protein [Sphingomonas sp. PR090111-T3T-6A]
MAPPADEPLSGTIRARFADLTARTPGRGEFALRIATICTLTVLVTQTYALPDVALSAYVVFFMLKPDRTGSVLTSVALTILISLLIGFLLFVAAHALDYPSLRVTIMAGLSLAMLFLASASKLKPFASTIALILAYGLDVLGKAPVGELATRALLYVWLIIAIPAGVAIVVNMLAGPAPRRLAERALAGRLRAAQALLAAPDESARRRVATLRRQGGAGVLGLLHLALMEKLTPRPHLQALQQAARSTDTLLMLAEAADRQPDMPTAWRQAAAATLGEMAAILDRHLYPVGIEPVAPAEVVALTGPATSLTVDFDAVLASFTVAPPPAAPAPKPKGGFFLPDAFSNPDHVRYAVKVTCAAMGCYLFYSLTDWQGIHTCLITCYIVALDTTAETVEKLSLRIAGALVGAAFGLAAIVWLIPQIDRIGGLLALVFAGALAGGWIAGGGPRIAYAGFQLTFAFFLCVIQGSSPDFDLTVARDRVIGILIGNAAIYLIFVTVWPVSIARRIDPAIAGLFRGLARIARLPDHGTRRDALPTAHAAVAPVATNLGIAGYEPVSMRPDRGWFQRRNALLESLSASEATLLTTDDRTALDAEAARLDTLADAVERGDPPAIDTSRLEQALAR